eukprot:4010188-Alexandrium_andersonii.AAC.1
MRGSGSSTPRALAALPVRLIEGALRESASPLDALGPVVPEGRGPLGVTPSTVNDAHLPLRGGKSVPIVGVDGNQRPRDFV